MDRRVTLAVKGAEKRADSGIRATPRPASRFSTPFTVSVTRRSIWSRSGRHPLYGSAASPVVVSYEGVAHFGGDDGISERPLQLAGCASLRAAGGRACVGSLRERSAPFEFPPDAG